MAEREEQSDSDYGEETDEFTDYMSDPNSEVSSSSEIDPSEMVTPESRQLAHALGVAYEMRKRYMKRDIPLELLIPTTKTETVENIDRDVDRMGAHPMFPRIGYELISGRNDEALQIAKKIARDVHISRGQNVDILVDAWKDEVHGLRDLHRYWVPSYFVHVPRFTVYNSDSYAGVRELERWKEMMKTPDFWSEIIGKVIDGRANPNLDIQSVSIDEMFLRFSDLLSELYEMDPGDSSRTDVLREFGELSVAIEYNRDSADESIAVVKNLLKLSHALYTLSKSDTISTYQFTRLTRLASNVLRDRIEREISQEEKQTESGRDTDRIELTSMTHAIYMYNEYSNLRALGELKEMVVSRIKRIIAERMEILLDEEERRMAQLSLENVTQYELSDEISMNSIINIVRRVEGKKERPPSRNDGNKLLRKIQRGLKMVEERRLTVKESKRDDTVPNVRMAILDQLMDGDGIIDKYNIPDKADEIVELQHRVFSLLRDANVAQQKRDYQFHILKHDYEPLKMEYINIRKHLFNYDNPNVAELDENYLESDVNVTELNRLANYSLLNEPQSEYLRIMNRLGFAIKLRDLYRLQYTFIENEMNNMRDIATIPAEEIVKPKPIVFRYSAEDVEKENVMRGYMIGEMAAKKYSKKIEKQIKRRRKIRESKKIWEEEKRNKK